MNCRSLVIVLCLFLASCSARPLPNVLKPNPDAVLPTAHVETILVATSRGLDFETQHFTSARSRVLHFQDLRVSIPPDHKVGQVEFNSWKSPTPEENMNTVSNKLIDEKQFIDMVDANLPPSGEVMVFVHGYNTTHQEAVLRLAQLTYDAKLQAEPILFSWPSMGRLSMYLFDKESAMASRNRLNDLLVLLQKDTRVKRINILAHSMGCMLTVETLMMAKLAGDGEYGGKLNNVTLAAPDIDIDVFLSEFEIIGKRGKPTVVLFSEKDKALAASRLLAGDRPRVGDFDPATAQTQVIVKEYGLSVVNVTDLARRGSMNHSVFATSSASLEQISLYLGGERSTVHNVGVFALSVTGGIAKLPTSGVGPIGNYLAH